MGSNPSAGTNSNFGLRNSDFGFLSNSKKECLQVRIPQSEIRNSLGALGKPGSSRLIFNQEMRGFESHTPRQLFGRILNVTTSFQCDRHARFLVALVSCAAIARVVQSAGDDSFKNCTVWVRIPPRVPVKNHCACSPTGRGS